MAEEVIIKVAEALQVDVGKGFARMDASTRDALGIKVGDAIELEGEKITAAKVFRAKENDVGLDIIRVDGLVRKNAGVSIGDKVIIRKAEMQPAVSVTISPLLSETHRIRFGPGIEKYVKKGLLERPLTKGDTIIVPGIALMGGSLPFVVVNTKPKGVIEITEDTKMIVKEDTVKEEEIKIGAVTYDDIGGLKDELSLIKETIELPLNHPELFDRLGVDPPKGILLKGSSGTGKTLISKAVAAESGVNCYTITAPEIMSKYFGESEERLRTIFENAEKNAPSIIFIEDLDSIAPKRSEIKGEVEARIVTQILNSIDKSGLNVMIIGETNKPHLIEPALRRKGRFDREIEIRLPNKEERKEILQIHTRGMPLSSDVNLEEIAGQTKDFSGAELAGLVRESAMRCLKRYLVEIDLDKPIPADVLERIKVTHDDFGEVLKGLLILRSSSQIEREIGTLEQIKITSERDSERISDILEEIRDFKMSGMKRCFITGSKGCSNEIKEEPKLVFIGMPLRDEYSDVYKHGILPVLKKFNLRPWKADEKIQNIDIMCKICQGIQTSKFAIINISGWNPNVLFELGLTYGLGKIAVIIKDKKEDVPVDLKRMEYIAYGKSDDILKPLESFFEHFIQLTR